MPTPSFLTLLDDIATTLDDVAVMTKVATKKTAGILGDDLAVNAEQVTGVKANRELPVVWAVAKGSTLNKVILVPAALAISAFVSWLITPLLMLGGTFLCYEGAHKVLDKLLHKDEAKASHEARAKALADDSVDLVEFEKNKIKGAVRTDFILSAEIIVIALGTVVEADFMTRVLTLIAVATIVTVGVYGLVALIVKLDDAGLALSHKDNPAAAAFGRGLVSASPHLMRLLAIAGTIAMFLVGGDILLHGIPGAETWIHDTLPHEGALGFVVGLGVSATTGVSAGLIVVGIVTLIQRARGKDGEAATTS